MSVVPRAEPAWRKRPATRERRASMKPFRKGLEMLQTTMRTLAALVVVTTPAAATTYAGVGHDVLGSLSDVMTYCTSSSQCVIVDSVPCSCANGGKQVAINAQSRKLWQSIVQDVRDHPLPIACATFVACIPKPKAVCVANHCTVKPAATGGGGIVVLPPAG